VKTVYIACVKECSYSGSLYICSDRTELNAPLPPLVAHILLTDDGAHRECMCKTDQPPCQLMRPQRINNRVETDTYYQPAAREARGRLVLRFSLPGKLVG